LDTRQKILPLRDIDALLSNGEWVIAVGQFDPLTAAEANRLTALGAPDRKLLAIVLENNEALLPAAPRAALIAALRDVNAVTVAHPENWRIAIPGGAHVRVVEDAASEKIRSAEFVRYIVGRQAAASDRGRNQ
jgi:hypothetical protein